MNKVKAENELFSGYMHQDAHEFLNFVLNSVSETLVSEAKAAAGSRANGRLQTPLPGSLSTRTPSLQSLQQQAMATAGKDASSLSTVRTWVDELFQGKLVNETRCLCCETVTNREEPFYDLSLEIDQNCSVTACLKRFSSNETLDAADKFSCDACACKQEAQKRMRIAKLPPVLCLHLKRFKYVESLGQMKKLTYRVVFPFELKLVNTTDDCEEQDVLYSLSAVVVHMGAHVNHGHYVALVKSGGKWLCFDDEAVHGVTEGQVKSTFGHTQEPLVRPDGQASLHVDHAYILFYQKVSPPRSNITAPDAADADCLP